MSVTIKFEGAKEIEAKLGQLESMATRRNVAKRAIMEALKPVAATAQRLAPKDEQDLERGIQVSDKATGRKSMKGDIVEAYVGIDPTADDKGRLQIYAGEQEEGNPARGMAAQPFMRPAAETELVPAGNRLMEAMLTEIEKAVGRQARKAAKG